MQLFLILLSSFFLASCSLFGPLENEPNSRFLLTQTPQIKKHSSHGISLLIIKPQISAIFDTNRIAYRTIPHQVGYYGLNFWAATPSDMLENLLLETLIKTHYFKAVATSTDLGTYDWWLQTHISEFLLDFTGGNPEAKIKIDVSVISAHTNRIIKTKTFYSRAAIPEISPYGGVVAANHAMAKMLKKITIFVISSRDNF